jgi:signal transduction histidine kinase
MVIILLYAVFAAIILYKAHWNQTRIKVGLLNLSIGIWLLGFDMLRISNSMLMVHIWSKVLFIVAPLIILLTYSFSLGFLTSLNRVQRIQNFLFPAIYLFIVSQFLFTENLLTGFNPHGLSLIEKARPGNWFPFCLIFYFYVTSFYVYNLIKAYRTSNQRVRMQIFYVAVSTGICLVISIVSAGVLPVFGIEKFIWVSPYSSFLIALAMTYAIYKYRLLELDVFIQKTLAYFFIALVVGALNVVIIYLSIQMLGMKITVNHYVLLILANVVIALFIFADTPQFEKFTREFFSKQKEEHYKTLERELTACTVYITLRDLLEFMAKLLEEKMQIVNVVVYLKDKIRDSNFRCAVKRGALEKDYPEIILNDNVLIAHLKRNPDVIEAGEFRHKYEHLYRNGKILDKEKSEIQTMMDKALFATVVLPIIQNDELGGIVVLGEKKSGFAYNIRDIQFLEKLTFDLSLTLENLKLKDQLVDKEKLALIGTIASSLAHEIHNPLASVKAFIAMLPPRAKSADFIEKFMEIVPRDIDRVISITKGLEAFALPTLSEPTLMEIDFCIEQALYLLQSQINTAQVKIVTEIDELPKITADSKKISQLFMNLILNACQASKPENKILIKATRAETMVNLDSIIVEIIDEGEGIKAEDMPNIFKPFYSTRIYGTGLGLPTCKRIVNENQGEIQLKSQEGKGTRVTVILPVNQK